MSSGNIRVSITNRVRLGIASPLSHKETVGWVAFVLRATSSWVIPRFSRAILSAFPIVLAIRLHAIVHHL